MADVKIAYERDTGMLDPTPRRSHTRATYERNATELPLLPLPPGLRNLIFTHVLGGWEFALRGGLTG
ncbi:hypothetical protein ST47_g3249 [Ascochyta rabiei]|uniref:Uncharacterized protein n=1 Tax=Didymella rabiei TaxID=5454 RepID=A0A163I128_DIDRA|nr:hypothetical protein ST47_g3249 [Ascochyta rabiei]